MPASLHASGVTVTLGARAILTDVELSLDPGHRVGLVGPNGVGKSTLLRVLSGQLAPERGSVQLRPGTATVGLLAQEAERAEHTVREALAHRTGVAAADHELQAASAALSGGDPGADDRYSVALDRWLALGAADLEARIGGVLAELGVAERVLDQPTASLSGGEAARVGLAALLLSRFDVLLLDEPTNDLDIDGLARLEQFVLGTNAAVAVVSHDRAFLDRVVTDVVELDEFTHRANRYGGSWQSYLDERERARRQAWERYETYETQKQSLLGRAQREREWATQGLSKAKRKPDDNDKNIKAFKINQSEQLAGKAARTERAIERLDEVEQPREAWQLQLTLTAAERSGDVVADLDDVVVRRGAFTLGPLSVHVAYGERIVIEGHNGAGKSTLLGLLLGEIEPDAGAARTGTAVKVGRLEQLRPGGAGSTVLDDFLAATAMTVSEARTLLAKFGIGAQHVGRPSASLSPGERTRLVLALLMARGTNCLVLDEPTNHLDLPAIEQLEQALDTFPGTVLLVSHDRALLGNVRRTRTLVMADGQLVADRPV
jgi:ATPase subunit of ABC transporter with duplicated ATPase domains